MYYGEKESARYYCTECSFYFNEPLFLYERHGFTHGPYEKLLCCPRCRMEDFVSEVANRAC